MANSFYKKIQALVMLSNEHGIRAIKDFAVWCIHQIFENITISF